MMFADFVVPISTLVGSGMKWGQLKAMLSLQLKVALLVLVHNLKFRDLAA